MAYRALTPSYGLWGGRMLTGGRSRRSFRDAAEMLISRAGGRRGRAGPAGEGPRTTFQSIMMIGHNVSRVSIDLPYRPASGNHSTDWPRLRRF